MAQRGWLGPGDAWPRHPRLDDILTEARAQGWWLKPADGGPMWGKIACAEPLGEDRRGLRICAIVIFRTSAASLTEQSTRIRRSLATCPHAPAAAT
jgi:hypothetical protein